jgi:hypothetical protein
LLLGLERLRISNAGAATFAGTITAPSYAIYGGLGTFLKLMVQLTSYATLGDNWYSWYQDLNLVVV